MRRRSPTTHLFRDVERAESAARVQAPKAAKGLKVVGLFAGIGGVELGLAKSGHEARMLCEFDDGASAVLAARFPGVELTRDVRTIGSLPSCDLLTAGFPCQDLSQAGRTRGITGEKSGLIQVVFELVERAKRKPRWLMLENVPFMLQLERGKGMAYLVRELRRLGYVNWAYRVVDTRSFGLPQRRRRVIMLASRTEDPRTVLFADDFEQEPDLPLEQARAIGFYWTEGIRGLGWAIESVPTLKGGSTVGIPSPPAIWSTKERKFGTPSIEDAERLQGFEAGWTEPITNAGVRASMRWKLVGNAVSVPVSEWVGKRLASPGHYDSFDDVPLREGTAWPNAAWGVRDEWHVADVGEWAGGWIPQPLSSFLCDDTKPLSVKATAGFIGRTRDPRNSLRMNERFLADLDHYLASIQDQPARKSKVQTSR
jgi:DNA (cytosine-5)-methyltransferase 1